MCGIAGILNLDPGEPVDLPRLERMRETLRHRGPDGEGLMTEGGVGLAHRRLAIMDPRGGRQPLQNEDGSLWIVCNGEIYNHPELRPWLEAKGHRYRTRSDTETILHLYEEDPERFVEGLRGMFAFALWDQRRRRLLLARDRLGIKPLYYAMTGKELLFGSEIKAILASGLIQPALNDEVVPEFLATRFVSGERTFFRGVRKLLPGRVLSCTPGGVPEQRRYWRLPEPEEPRLRSFRGQALLLKERLDEAVRSHLMSDVPLGLFLSGGLDSTALAVLMARRVREPIRTFSVGFEDPRANELAFARLASDAVRSEHREVVVRPEEFFSVLPRLVWHEDEPLAFEASVPLYFVSRLAARHVKVVLTGEGADELFLGYNRYRVAAFNERLGGPYSRLVPASLRDRVARWLRRLPRGARRYVDRSFLARPPGFRGGYCENFSVFSGTLRNALLRNPETSGPADPHGEILSRLDETAGSALDRISRADLQTYLVELLMKQDQMSMAASLESRVPYLDHPLVEHVAALPARFKLRGLRSKAVLRAALQDLVPPEILARRKMGFPVPLGSWLRGPHWGVVEEYVLSPRALERNLFRPGAVRTLAEEHRRGLADHGSRLWLLINLEAWHRIFIDREGVATFPGEPEPVRASVA